jgi:hypothetical protein
MNGSPAWAKAPTAAEARAAATQAARTDRRAVTGETILDAARAIVFICGSSQVFFPAIGLITLHWWLRPASAAGVSRAKM